MQKVFFTCSTREFAQRHDTYATIVRIITGQPKTKIVHNWIEDQKAGNVQDEDKIVDIYETVNEAISAADVVVVEGSVSSMSLGYQIVLAVQMKKPVLFLQAQGVKKDSFVIGLNSPFVWSRYYTENNLETVLEKFLKYFNEAKRLRFNLVLDSEQVNFITWKAFKEAKQKTRVIKDLIDTEAFKDKDYRKFLSGEEK
ncbi:MAG: hypothetical protein ACD_61C00007G0006 [uncultured bacterium]|nr:MAG: hypothetical protein ACD_61C00007G0006 [uncultured bacterium]